MENTPPNANGPNQHKAPQALLKAESITAILNGKTTSHHDLDRVFSTVYSELKRLAQNVLNGSASNTLNSTALVHEAYAKLICAEQLSVDGRQHFYALCGRIMRQIVIDHARKKLAVKHGGGQIPVTWQEDLLIDMSQPESLVSLDEALNRLEQLDDRLVNLIHYRVFAGLELDDIAPLLGVTVRQLQRDWQRARIWITEELSESRED